MEANLLAAQPLARELGEYDRGGEHQEPQDDARDDRGEEPGVESARVGGIPRRLATMSLLALVVVQLLWVALLAYLGYSAVVWLGF